MFLANLVIWPFLIALVVGLITAPLTIWFFRNKGWVIDPKKTPHPAHTHKVAVPKGGGLIIYLGVIVSLVLFLKIDRHLWGIIGAATLTLVVGLIDDIWGMKPSSRLITNFLAAGLVVSSGIGIAYITRPGGGIIDLSTWRWSFFLAGKLHEIWVLPDLFALIWIPFLMNAINFSSGVDGQASGMIAIAAAVVGILSLNYSADITQWPVAILAFALAGASVALTIFHFYPQKIMPGYSATTLAGLLLGVFSILSTTKVGTAMMVLSLPLIDAVYTVIRRLATGKSPFYGDRGHFHHKLMQLGWGKRRIALFYWGITALMGYLALEFNAEKKLFAILALAIAVIGVFLWIYFGNYSKQPGRDNG